MLVIPTQQELKNLLHYDPETGYFTWLKCNPYYHNMPSNFRAGGRTQKGYIEIRIGRKGFKAHRLAWVYMHGEMPEDQIDHINGIKDDNRIANLRPASNSENCRNRPKAKHNTSGHKGIYWVADHNKWRVIIRFNDKNHHFGYFKDKDDAIAEANRAREELHRHFANHG